MRRLFAGLLAVTLTGQAVASGQATPKLTLGDGVVVKFGAGASLVVRDQISVGEGVVFSSLKDDSAGGRTLPAAATPAAGDWRGVRIEQSALRLGLPSLRSAGFFYAGGADWAALTLRGGYSATASGLQFVDNRMALRLIDGASPRIEEGRFVRNDIGIHASAQSLPTVRNTQFSGNRLLAIKNLDTEGSVSATGNWWGHPSGPTAPDYPEGRGDAVSAGVEFGPPLSAEPLINPRVRLAAPAQFVPQGAVTLDLACGNAVEYRIAEVAGLAGATFQPLPEGRGQRVFAPSPGEGRKTLFVEFRGASGQTVTASLEGGLMVDNQPPTVSLSNPSNGARIADPIDVLAVASDSAGIAKVEFHLNGSLAATVNAAPYTWRWNTDGFAEGDYALRAVATDNAGRTSEQRVNVSLERGSGIADTQGPSLSSVTLDGNPLASGSTVTRGGMLGFEASDRSGVAKVELLVNQAPKGVSTVAGQGRYEVPLSLESLDNGNHTVQLRATDSLGNVSVLPLALTVAHAAPDTPALVEPADGAITRAASINVRGTAMPGVTVQVLLNGEAVKSLAVGPDGRFSSQITLAAGENRLQVAAGNARGVSPASGAVRVVFDNTIPLSPTNLRVSSQPAGAVRLVWSPSTDTKAVGYWVYRAQAAFSALDQATRITLEPLEVPSFDDTPPQDGTWHYRVVAVNQFGTPSAPSNAVSALADSVPPRATSIVYSTSGKTDPATGRFGQGLVSVLLTTSEPLQMVPYLAMVPQGGVPQVVDLTATGPTTFSGRFVVDSRLPSGLATAVFSGRDSVGNRGSEVVVGATLGIQTEGPVLTGIVLDPSAPLKSDAGKPVQVTFTFDKAPAVAPMLSFQLSGPVRSAVPIAAVTALNATTWRATVNLPADAGLSGPETLAFSHESRDSLDNVSNRVVAANQFQVYRGALPPLDVPLGLTAEAQPGGRVKLSWREVASAASYQIYRQAPNQAQPEPLARSFAKEYSDLTPADGRYRYAVASVRVASAEESVSGQGPIVEVQASRTAPAAPQNLSLTLGGQGVYAAWQPSLSSHVDHYRLYRAQGSAITRIDGLAPIKTRIKTPRTWDTEPSPTEAAYAVTAVDAAGNESQPSNSAYLNASLLPVRDLRVEQTGSSPPILTWAAPGAGVAGYVVYVGPESAKVKLTAAGFADTRFTDTGFVSGERRYHVAAVDAAGTELGRSILLPSASAQVVSGLPVRRGIMNRLQVQVTNASASTLNGVRASLRLPIDRAGQQFREHKSEIFTLGPNQTRLVPVVVGGYAEMASSVIASVGLDIAANEGELVRVARNQTLTVSEGTLVVNMATDEFTRGATGKVRLTIENPGEADIEMLTATAGGSEPSTEVRFTLLDRDGNVLSRQPFKQVFGAGVITLTNAETVARIPAGGRFVSDAFDLNIPATPHNTLRVRLEVDALRHRSGEPDGVVIAGRGTEKTVSLIDTAYYGEVSQVSPVSSFGTQDVVITGRAVERGTGTPLPNTKLKLILNQQGFDRLYTVITDPTGQFTHTFKPTLTDAGLFKVSAVHPDVSHRPEQKAFTLNRVSVSPSHFKLDVPRNYPFTIPFDASAGPGASASNLRLVLDAASQPTGRLPVGVTVTFPPAVSVGEGQPREVPVQFVAANNAQPSGTLIFGVVSDESPTTPIAQVRLDYVLTEARPYLLSTPSFVETGMNRGQTRLESVTIKNNGTQEALNIRFSLTRPDGSAAPAWARISSQPDGSLAVGQARSVDLSFLPGSDLANGTYEFRLAVTGDNIAPVAINVYVALTEAGQGAVLFKASDIYTGTTGKDGALVKGLANATVTLQNEDVASISVEGVTDAVGEALFSDLPAGRYRFRVKSDRHQERAGRLIIKPGLTATQPVFLEYQLITVEWSVREITIEDRYEITLSATFETEVPAPVLVLDPPSVNLPAMGVGDVFQGELTLTNFGLVRADEVTQTLPADDGYFRYEFLVEPPTTLEPKQRVTLPYRIVALKALGSEPDPAPEPVAGLSAAGLSAAGSASGAGQASTSRSRFSTSASSSLSSSGPSGRMGAAAASSSGGGGSGGGCYNYSNATDVKCKYTCANGVVSDSCGSATNWFSNSQASCDGGTSFVPGYGVGSGGWGGAGGPVGIGSGGGAVFPQGPRCAATPTGAGGGCK